MDQIDRIVENILDELEEFSEYNLNPWLALETGHGISVYTNEPIPYITAHDCIAYTTCGYVDDIVLGDDGIGFRKIINYSPDSVFAKFFRDFQPVEITGDDNERREKVRNFVLTVISFYSI